MWGTTGIFARRNLKIIFANKKLNISSLNNLVIERYNSTNKSVPNTAVNKSCQGKDSLRKEIVDYGRISRKVKFAFGLLGLSIIVAGAYVFIELQKPDENGLEIPAWKQYLKNLFKQIENFTLFFQEPSRDKLLPDVLSYPYYQPPYTLILGLTDVLAHADWTYKTGWRFKKRPGLDYMLENLVGLYEIVIFTSESGMTIFPVIEALDPKGLISYKLVRDSTHFVDGHHVKNLDKLNRDLKKVIVVDWNSESIKFHPDNHLNVTRWEGNDDDTALVDLTSFLMTVAHTEIDDVREVLRFYKQYDDPLTEFRRKQMQYYEENNKQKQEQPKLPRSLPNSKKVFDYFT
ncbi:mitochondrial import inner membrane translocase subunit TIM50-C-like [Diorhabda sublineata]|uniref:mitochondrial import inner membrane translocase subunit TIM50-C-like n=1 Tax=Diorhabda sublineata TaxID=1163346 RepID=UPI0024E04D16|nr:mitochondrial import inner membrane translocase subunit TIM50-C-like [Diorhabda sublineata]